MHRLHRNGGLLRGTTRNKLLIIKKHVRYCKERGPLRWWNFVTLPRQLAGLHIDKANIVRNDNSYCRVSKDSQNDIKHTPQDHCVLCIKKNFMLQNYYRISRE